MRACLVGRRRAQQAAPQRPKCKCGAAEGRGARLRAGWPQAKRAQQPFLRQAKAAASTIAAAVGLELVNVSQDARRKPDGEPKAPSQAQAHGAPRGTH